MSAYTSGSGAYFNDDGSCGIGVECFFDANAPSATQSWPLSTPVNAVEMWGNVSMRTFGTQTDVLVGVYLDEREIWGAILKANNEGTVNLPAHQNTIGPLKTPATVLRVDMAAAASGDSWNNPKGPVNCEIRLCGRWE